MLHVQKIPVDGGFTCPNRDGTRGQGGCSFCQPSAFAPGYCKGGLTITGQLEAGKRFFAQKHRGRVTYHAYFQSFSGTYAPVEVLRQRYEEALSVPDVTGLVIGTRPDCISTAILDLLSELQQRVTVEVEFGVESCYDRTLQRVGRGHDYQCACHAIRATASRGIPVGVHLILGFPGETEDDILHEADLLSQLPISTLKLHQLQIMQGTRMADEWRQHPDHFPSFTAGEYAALVARFIQRLSPAIHLERFAAGAPSQLLLSPRWGLKPLQVQRMVEEQLEKLKTTPHDQESDI